MRKQISTLIAESLLLYLENELLEGGEFSNVTSGDIDHTNLELGKLVAVNEDKDYNDGVVFQSPLANWVYESGLKINYGYTSPTAVSGIYVNGTLYGRSDATHGHYIDYQNGRVIFKSAQLASLDVRADYSYKNYTVGFAYPNKILALEHSIYNRDIFLHTPPFPSGRLTLPAILFQFNSEARAGYQLGGGKISRQEISLHIIGHSETQCANVANFIEDKDECSIRIIDFSHAPYPLNFYNDYSNNYVSYSGLKSQHTLYNANIRDIATKRAPGDGRRYIVNMTIEAYT